MDPAAHTYLAAWESFYVIVGSSGAALTGLQFVVIALIAESEEQNPTNREISAFGTPTVVHFCAALLVSAILSAPWHSLSSVGLAIGLCGAAGIFYTGLVIRRARRQTGYKPVFEDWLWHTVLPLIAYVALLVSSIILRSRPEQSLFVIGCAAVLLIFIGIHNSWDTVTYIAVRQSEKAQG
jgi:hypothetical protein